MGPKYKIITNSNCQPSIQKSVNKLIAVPEIESRINPIKMPIWEIIQWSEFLEEAWFPRQTERKIFEIRITKSIGWKDVPL